MFSFDIIVQTGDGHSIFDIKTGKNINSNKKMKEENILYKIELGDHVWVGRCGLILGSMKPTVIGSGSIVGAQSVVKGKFPNNVILAGTPAKVIKKDIAWSRKNMADNMEDCNGYSENTKEV